MHYSIHSNHVRVDFFKPGGKWKYTEEVVWDEQLWPTFNSTLYEVFRLVLINHLGRGAETRMRGLVAVCLDPYFENAHPIMFHIPEDGL
jgi:hypothetical protein